MKILYPFQKEVLSKIYKENRIALFLKMRLGKTLITLRRLRREKAPFLIVAPNDALISWKIELDSECESYTHLTGTKKKRLSLLLNSKTNYFLLNKEGFIALPEIRKFSWTAVILDESHFIKNPKAKVTKFFCKNFKNIPIKIILTGTPNPVSELDYISQLLFLQNENLKVNTYWDFRFRHCYQAGFDYKLKESGKKLLASSLSSAIFLNRENVGIYIPKVYTVRELELPSKLRKAYDFISENFCLKYGKTELFTKYAMQAFQWQRQICTGFLNGNLVWKGKYDALLNLLEGELKGEQVVLWTNNVYENDFYYQNLKKLYKTAKISGSTPVAERLELVKNFNKGNITLFVVQASCATYGINLSSANTTIYLSCPIGYLVRKQTEDRILNIGSKKSLLYIDFIVKDTIDEDVLQSIKDRETEITFMKRVLSKLNKRKQ